MGDKLLLNFGFKDQHKFIISHVKKLLQSGHGNVWCVSVPKWCQSVVDEDFGVFKDTLENLNTRMTTSRRTLTGILSKNSKTFAGSFQYDKQVKEPQLWA